MIPEEMKKCIGMVNEPKVYEVEKGAIRRYAEAVGDDNPLYNDEEYAKKTRYGGIIAPPGFFGWLLGKTTTTGTATLKVIQAAFDAGHYAIIDAGKSFEFFMPVRPGDVLVGSPVIEDIVEKKGKSGLMFMVRFKTTYVNQNGDVVAHDIHHSIFR